MCSCCCCATSQKSDKPTYTKFELQNPKRSEVHWENITDAPELYTKDEVDALLVALLESITIIDGGDATGETL